MSIQAMKGVSVGDAFDVAGRVGSEAHDESSGPRSRAISARPTGGLGQDDHRRAARGPRRDEAAAHLTRQPLRSVDTETHQPAAALRERTDSCTVPAAGVVGEAMVALVMASTYREKFGGDHIDDVTAALDAYRERIGWRR